MWVEFACLRTFVVPSNWAEVAIACLAERLAGVGQEHEELFVVVVQLIVG